MIDKTKVLALMTAAAMLTACGGGGDGTSTAAPDAGTNTPTNPNTPNNPGTPTNPNNPTDPNTPTNPTNPVTDTKLRGELSIVANQIPYIKADRAIYNATTVTEFEEGLGMYDLASGATSTTGTAAVPPSAVAPAAPIAAFGFRIDKYVQPTTTGEALGGQTAVGRVAIELVERAGSAGIGNGEVAESMRLLIDKVELKTDAEGQLISAKALTDAKVYVEGRNATGVTVTETLPAAATSVRLLPVQNVLDHEGDTNSVVLLIDLEAALGQAQGKLAALNNLEGHFDMRVTMSPAQLVRPASTGTPALPRKVLTGQSITVGSQPAVTGTGVVGTAWIRTNPPPQTSAQ